MSSSKDFRILLFQLDEKLNAHDIEGIVSIEDLPAEFNGQSALKVLLKLEMTGRISAAKPQSLEDVLKDINRIDLVKKVKDFSRSQKKSSKRHNTASATAEERIRTLSANLEVTRVQMRLLLDQLEHLRKTAQETGPKSVEMLVSEAQEDAELLEKKLLYAKTHLEDDCSPISDDSFSPPATLRQRNSFELELQQHLAKSRKSPAGSPKMTTADQTVPSRTAESIKIISQESEYAEVIRPPRLIVKSEDDFAVASFESASSRPTDGREGSSALVTGTLRSPMNRKKPVPPPKPGKFQKVGSKDAICPRIEESKAEDEDEGNYTGGTTAGTTGGATGSDSGFSNAREFLKVDLPTNQEVPGYYKALRREDVGVPSYYKFAGRETATQPWHDLMKDTTKPAKNEIIYQNLRSDIEHT